MSVGRRYATVVEIASAIPPGNSRLPKGVVGPLTERYGVGAGYPNNLFGRRAKLRSMEPRSSISQTNVVDFYLWDRGSFEYACYGGPV